MNRIALYIVLILIVSACHTQKGIIKVNSASDKAVSVPDSAEYQLETFDSQFESWYLLHKSPSQNRLQSYYETWNRQYVSEWNHKAIAGKNSFFEPVIGYEPSVDYGFELNHKLFHYFMYVEKVLKIKILSNGPNFTVW